MTTTPQQEAEYAYAYGLDRGGLSPAARDAYDKLVAQHGYVVPPEQAPSKPARAPSRWNGLDVTAFVLAWVLPLVGLILGIVGIASAHRDGRQAHGLSIAAVVIGGLAVVIVTVVVIAVAVAAHSTPDYTQEFINCSNAQVASNPLPPYCSDPNVGFTP